MIRRKKSIYLAVLALSAVSLSGCGEVSNNSEGYVLTSEYNGIKLDINTNDIIERYISENRNEHAAALYDALNEVVIRMAFEEGGVLADFKSTVEREATEAVNKKKDEIDEGDQTWDEFLEGEIPGDDLTTEQREQEYFLDQEYTAMKTTVDEQYFDRFSGYERDANADDAALQDEYNLLYGTNGYIQKKVPYDIRHILIQVDASDDYGYSRGHISATNIEDMYRVFEALIGGNDFADVANSYTDDTGNDGENGKNGGEYLMDNAESFVNEFKLGVYTYDLLINNQYNREGMSDADKAIYDEKYNNLHIPTSAEEGLTDFGVTYIPYEVIQKLYDVRNVTTANGVSVYDGNEDYLPRNIYFNKYFQNRNIAFVTDERMLTTEELIGEETVPSDWSSYGADGNAMLTREDAVSGEKVFSDINDDGHYETSDQTYERVANNDLFQPLTINGVTKNVLCDTNGNPIMVVRNQESSSGIHLIVIERSAFDTTGATEKEPWKSTIEEYYAPVSPKDTDSFVNGRPDWNVDDFPSYTDGEVTVPKKTYVQTEVIKADSDVNDTVSNYTARVSTLSSEIKGSIDTYDTYFWLNPGKYTLNKIANSDVQAMVNTYIEKEINATEESSAQTLEDSWINYLNSIVQQTRERQYMLLPEILAAEFGNPNLYKEGAPGYNAAYYDVSGNTNGGTSTGSENA